MAVTSAVCPGEFGDQGVRGTHRRVTGRTGIGELLHGAEPQVIRVSKTIRESLCEGFTHLKETLDTLVIPKPTRAFSFEEE